MKNQSKIKELEIFCNNLSSKIQFQFSSVLLLNKIVKISFNSSKEVKVKLNLLKKIIDSA